MSKNDKRVVEELVEMKAREGVFFGSDKGLRKMQYEKAKTMMIDIQIADYESDYHNYGEIEQIDFIIDGNFRGYMVINHDREDYFLKLDWKA